MSKSEMNTGRSVQVLGMRKLLWAGLLGVGLLFAQANSFACSCAPYPADKTRAAAMAYARADVIFLGSVTGTQSSKLRALSVRDVSFDVLVSWKGLSGHSGAVVRTAKGELACGFKFRRRGRYLVVAYWDTDQNVLWTNMCELTRKEAEARDLIAALDKLVGQKKAVHEEADEDATDSEVYLCDP